MCTKYAWPTSRFQSASLWRADGGDAPVQDRQDRVPGFQTSALRDAHGLLIGAGGLMGPVAYGLARKGLGLMDICDHDLVEVSNLNRQHFFWSDVGQPKALRLARNVAMAGHLGSECWGHHIAFTEETAPTLGSAKDVVVCGVDNNRTRAVASRFFRQCGIPVVFTGVNVDANYGYTFVQEAGGPCLACVFPRIADSDSTRQECRPVPAVLDILQTMSGLVLYAIDTLLMPRPRYWNFRSVHLVGGSPDCCVSVEARPGCRLCQAAGEANAPLDTKEVSHGTTDS